MSFEGHYQTLCKSNHVGPNIACSYGAEDEQRRAYRCDAWIDGKECGAEIGWSNMVDDTNCDSHGHHKMIRQSEEEVRTCNFGHPHVWTAATYKPSEFPFYYDQEKDWMEMRTADCPKCGDTAYLSIREDDPSDTSLQCPTCSNKAARQGSP